MTMKRTWGGPNAPHIKTLTLGKNVVIIQRGPQEIGHQAPKWLMYICMATLIIPCSFSLDQGAATH